jgi:membrane fusion protein (multidrug efflux system)
MKNGTSTPADAPPEKMDRLPRTMDRIAAALEKHNDLAKDKRDSGNAEKPGENKEKNGGKSKDREANGDEGKKTGGTKSFFVSPLGIVLELAVLTMLVVAGVFIWKYVTTHVSTDDAYTTTDVHQISSRVVGTVMEVWVADNQRVRAGSLLVKLDTRDYEVALESAHAGLGQARANVLQAEATLIKAQAGIEQAEAQVTQARAQTSSADANQQLAGVNYKRESALFIGGVVAKSELDNSKGGRDATKGAFDAAKANTLAAEANTNAARSTEKSNAAALVVSQAQVETAQSSVDYATLQLSYCWVIAPCDGQVSQKTVETGQSLSAGQALMAVTENDVWVLANLKETQLEHVRVGQRVKLVVDTFPKHPFTGRVDSIEAGSGATYALLPPDNATGNFTKIVQRVPVKLTFDRDSIKGYEDLVVAGLSVTPSIDLTTTGDRASKDDPAPLADRNGR